MGKRLDELIEYKVSNIIRDNDGEFSSLECTEARTAVFDHYHQIVKSEIKEELTADELQKLKADAEAQLKQESIKKNIASLRQILGEGIILAMLIGLLVNQITNLIAYWENPFSPWVTFGIIVILLFSLGFFILYRVTDIFKRILDLNHR